MRVTCTGCGQTTDVTMPEPPKIINMVSVSLVVIEHRAQSICESCGSTLVPTVTDIQAMFNASVVPKKKEALIVMPGRN